MEGLKGKAGKLVLFVVIGLLVAGGIFFVVTREKTDVEIMMAKLENASELTTQKLVINDQEEMTAGKIPVITKDKFTIKYKAIVRAGINVSEAEIDAKKDKVTVTMPHAKIQSVEIPPEKIQIVDTGFTIIRAGKKETVAAQKELKELIKKKSKQTELIGKADENSAKLVKELLANSAGDRELVIEYK